MSKNRQETVSAEVEEYRHELDTENPWGADEHTAWINSASVRSCLDRIEAADRRVSEARDMEKKEDERLLKQLLYFAVEDYCGQWATKPYKATVQAVCKRLGIRYTDAGRSLTERIEGKMQEGDKS